MKKILGIVLILFALAHTPMTEAETLSTEEQLRTTLIALITKLQAQLSQPVAVIPSDRERFEFDAEGAEVLAVYQIQQDTLVRTSSIPEQQGFVYWQDIMRIIPDDLRARVGELVIYADKESTTDALVEPLYTDGIDVWRLAINQEAVGTEYQLDFFTELVVHEYAHVLSLNETQIDFDASESSCDTFYTIEGCPFGDSYYQELIDKFWDDDLLDASLAAEEARNPEQAVEEYYEEYADQFVTDYAATNPGEDWAETFATFVLYEKPTGNSIAEQKVLSLFEEPDLVKLRQEILGAI